MSDEFTRLEQKLTTQHKSKETELLSRIEELEQRLKE